MENIAKKIAGAIKSGLDRVSEDEREKAEALVDDEQHQLNDDEKLTVKFQEYTVSVPPEDIKKNITNTEPIDRDLDRIENVAFKYHFHNVEHRYFAQFPALEIANKESEDNDENSNPESKGSNEKRIKIRIDSPAKYMHGIRVEKIVFNQEELQSEKLNNVFSSLSGTGVTLAMVIHRTHTDCSLYFIVKANSLKDSERIAKGGIDTLNGAFCGNFPGSIITDIEGGNEIPKYFKSCKQIYENLGAQSVPKNGAEEGKTDKKAGSITELFDQIFTEEQCKAVSALITVPAFKSPESKYFNQGIEKLIDGVVPAPKQSYTLLLLAEPLDPQEVSALRGGYEDLASMISPFCEIQYNQTYTKGQTKENQKSENLSNTVTVSTNYAVGMGAHAGASAQASASVNNGINAPMEGENGNTLVYGVKDGWALKREGHEIKTGIAGGDTLVGKQRTGITENYGSAEGASANASASVNIHADLSQNIASGRSFATTIGYGCSMNQQKSEGATYTFTSSRVQDIYNRLEKEIDRINSSESCGLWNFSSYAIASSRELSKRVANTFHGLVQGESSSIERSAINVWDSTDKDNFEPILVSLLDLRIPSFTCRDNSTDESLPKTMLYATEVSSSDLALLMNMPQKAVPGIPVVNSVPFGRNICKLDGEKIGEKTVRLGCLYHMSQTEEDRTVNIDVEKLTSHLFVTGSTGTGKSNSIYKLLEELFSPANNNGIKSSKNDIHFMVIEPAKGEYKNIFGGWQDVTVYGTNPKLSDLLVLNPFEFPSATIHVLEHIDRLVEIFNACWPMYAAMPAILKEAIIESYKAVGWDLDESENKKNRFPTFKTLLEILPGIIKKSQYSQDTSNDYIGALVTRVNSLTTGLSGRIFDSLDSKTDTELFEKNVVIDLSMTGSPETKALIMGMLVLRLQEYHINRRLESIEIKDNEPLNHMTILEEAHLLLRKSSFDQSQEGANLQGKSVEMLSNAIAEMRTYGESFIIADQAPALLDQSVIRNTGTKIVLRLPDQQDRDLMGSALALSEEQVAELAKIPNKVAAVYQSDWQEAVLCKVDAFSEKFKKPYGESKRKKRKTPVKEFMGNLIAGRELKELEEAEKKEIRKELIHWMAPSSFDITAIEKLLKGENISKEDRSKLEYDLFRGDELVRDMYFALDTAENEKLEKVVDSVRRRYGFEEISTAYNLIADCFAVVRQNQEMTVEEEQLLCNKERELREHNHGIY